MPDGDLAAGLGGEISIGFRWPDGSVGSTPVWVAQAGDASFGRLIRGRRGGWYRRLRTTPTARSATGPIRTPRACPVEDAGTVEAVTGASAAKYGDSPYVRPLLTGEAADATLRLELRP